MTTFAGCCVAVHALDAGSGKGADKIVLCLLGARSKIKKGIEGALAADQRIGAACVAVMAEQISACTMIGKAYLTVIAFRYPSADRAKNHRCKAAPV
jgi:hypothetical protein